MKAYILKLNKEANLLEQWDFGLVKDFLDGNLWQTVDWETFELEEVKKLPKKDKAIVCIAARHHTGLEEEVNKNLKNIKNVVLFLLGDEEAEFNISIIKHSNISIWVQNPHIKVHDKYNKLGTGYPERMKNNLPVYSEKKYNIFFSGQNTHDRRRELVEAIETINIGKVIVNETQGFTQGLEASEYYDYMSKAIICPAPSGAVIPDSFRLFEALEMMAIPIADQKTPNGEVMEYWDWLFNEITPFPKIDNWFELKDIALNIITYTNSYQEIIQKQTEWWIKWKRNFAYKVMEQLNA
jgi:hypothetical protein